MLTLLLLTHYMAMTHIRRSNSIYGNLTLFICALRECLIILYVNMAQFALKHHLLIFLGFNLVNLHLKHFFSVNILLV